MNQIIASALDPNHWRSHYPFCTFSPHGLCSRHLLSEKVSQSPAFQKQLLRSLMNDDWSGFASVMHISTAARHGELDCGVSGNLLSMILAFEARRILWRYKSIYANHGSFIQRCVRDMCITPLGLELVDRLFRKNILTPHVNLKMASPTNGSLMAFAITTRNLELLRLCFRNTGYRMKISLFVYLYSRPMHAAYEQRWYFRARLTNVTQFDVIDDVEPINVWLGDVNEFKGPRLREVMEFYRLCCMMGCGIAMYFNDDVEVLSTFLKSYAFATFFSGDHFSLQNCCRLRINKELAHRMDFVLAVKNLPLPTILQDFLLVSDM